MVNWAGNLLDGLKNMRSGSGFKPGTGGYFSIRLRIADDGFVKLRAIQSGELAIREENAVEGQRDAAHLVHRPVVRAAFGPNNSALPFSRRWQTDIGISAKYAVTAHIAL